MRLQRAKQLAKNSEFLKQNENNVLIKYIDSNRKNILRKYPKPSENTFDKDIIEPISNSANVTDDQKVYFYAIHNAFFDSSFPKDKSIDTKDLARRANELFDKTKDQAVPVKKTREKEPAGAIDIVDGKPEIVNRSIAKAGDKNISFADAFADIIAGKSVLKSGSKGNQKPFANDEMGTATFGDLQILLLQKWLNNHLSPSPNLEEDMKFGPATKAAVIRFQKAAGISQDGIVGRQTILKMIPETKSLTNIPVTGVEAEELTAALKTMGVLKESHVVRLDESTLRRLIRESLRKLI